MELIIAHGLGQDPKSWEEVINNLGNINVSCPELFSVGETEEISWDTVYKHFEDYCLSKDKPFCLMGLSLGAMAALRFALSHPEKVEKLILIAAQIKSPKALLALQTLLFKLMPEKNFDGIGMAKADFIRLTKSMSKLDFTDNLKSCPPSMPMLILCGGEDSANKLASQKLAEMLPNAIYYEIPNSSHEVNKDNPQKLAEEVEKFLEG